MTEAVNYNNYLVGLITQELNGLPKEPLILDFGAGSGTYAEMLKNKGFKVDCLEPDKELQKLLKKKKYRVVSDAKALKPNSYDVIYALNVLEHIDDDYKVFAQLSKALKKNGIIVI